MRVGSRFIVSVNKNIIDKGNPGREGWHNEVVDTRDLIQIIKHGYAFSPGVLKEGFNKIKHSKDDVELAYIAAVDVDNGDLESAAQDDFLRANALLLYTTPSHTEQLNRYRILFLAESPITNSQDYEKLAEYLQLKTGADKSCKDICRLFYGNRKAEFVLFNSRITKQKQSDILKRTNGVAKKAYSNPKVDEIKELLSYIPPDFGPGGYIDWLKILSAVVNEVGEEIAVPIIDAWSPDTTRGTAYKAKHALKDISIGTLKYYARQNGYKDVYVPVMAEQSLPVGGVYSVVDREAEYRRLYYEGVPHGATLGYTKFDELFKWFPGQLTVLTGIPSHGKSNWMTQVMIRLAINNGWRCAIFSSEETQEIHMTRMAEILVGKPFYPGYNNRMTEDEMSRALDVMQQHFFYINPHNEEYSLENILKCTTELIEKEKINFLLIDPWNTLEHQYRGISETTYTGKVLNKLKHFARNNMIHIVLAAHPTKIRKNDKTDKFDVPTPYDISGSANWYNVPDNILTVYRIMNDEELENQTVIYVQKVKHQFIGRVGYARFKFRIACKRYDPLGEEIRYEAEEKIENVQHIEDPPF